MNKMLECIMVGTEQRAENFEVVTLLVRDTREIVTFKPSDEQQGVFSALDAEGRTPGKAREFAIIRFYGVELWKPVSEGSRDNKLYREIRAPLGSNRDDIQVVVAGWTKAPRKVTIVRADKGAEIPADLARIDALVAERQQEALLAQVASNTVSPM